MSWPQEKDTLFPIAEDDESYPSTDYGSDDLNSECASTEGDSEGEPTSPFSFEQTCLILDWDDTLLPTTWLTALGLGLSEEMFVTEEQRSELSLMAGLAEQTLRAAQTFGTVVIVTNAEEGWVELSCEKFMPSLCPLLQTVKILSARSTYEPQGVVRPSEWKYWAFKNEIHGFYDLLDCEKRKNIISIGDSLHERKAVIQAAENLSNSCVKALKLKTKPDLDELLQQHQLIFSCLGDVVCHEGNLDVCIQ